MHHLMLTGLLLVAQIPAQVILPDPSAPLPVDLEAYETRRQAAGRDPDDQFRLALWCEQHGLKSERDRHLALVLILDPDHAGARGVMGFVRQADRWVRPQAATADPADPETQARLDEYQARRSRLDDRAEDHWRLGLWCEQNGLPDQARAHFWNTIRLDPSRKPAWKRLGYEKHDGQWLTDAQFAALKADREAQAQANDHWEPLLRQLRDALRSDDAARQEDASRELASIQLPRSVPAAMSVFGTADPSDQSRLVQLLGQVDSVASSWALSRIALTSAHAEVRRLAIETLRGRDPREFAGDLIALIGTPIEYSVQPVGGPGSPGILKIASTDYDINRVYTPPSTPGLLPGDLLLSDPASGSPVAFRVTGDIVTNPAGAANLGVRLPGYEFESIDPLLEALIRNGQPQIAEAVKRFGDSREAAKILNPELLQNLGGGAMLWVPTYSLIDVTQIQQEKVRAAMAAQSQLERDVSTLEAYNQPIQQRNDRLFSILNAVAAKDIPPDRASWTAWYTDLIGFRHLNNVAATGRGSFMEEVPIGFQPMSIERSGIIPMVIQRMSCFAAGTPVRTDRGLRPIEQVQVGDLVLAQDQQTGALAYRPVNRRFDNPPSKTFAIKAAGEEIVSSEFHRFWKTGAGWVMARDLKPGDSVRLLGGLARVESMTAGAVQPVYNLDVDTDASFFVGRAGLLVHDNTVPGLRSGLFDAIGTGD